MKIRLRTDAGLAGAARRLADGLAIVDGLRFDDGHGVRIAGHLGIFGRAGLAGCLRVAGCFHVAGHFRFADCFRFAGHFRPADHFRFTDRFRSADHFRPADRSRFADHFRPADRSRFADRFRPANRFRFADRFRLANRFRPADRFRLANRFRPADRSRIASNIPVANRAGIARRVRLTLCALVASLALTNATRASVSVADDTGQTVTLAAPARRVISLAPHVTELIYAAGGGAKLVGAVAYSDYPPEAQAVPRVGDNRSLDLERIIALKPDLIVVWRHGNAQQQIDRLRALHIPLFFSEPHRLDDVATSLARLGALLGTAPVADAAAASFRHDIAQLRARYADRAPVGVFYEVWDQPLMTVNGTHMISDVIALCGGRNVFAALRPLVPTLTTEAVLAANPAAIVTTARGATAPDRPLPALERWRAWPTLSAVAHDNLFAIDGDLLTRPAPRLVQGAAQLCEDLDLARSRLAGRAR